MEQQASNDYDPEKISTASDIIMISSGATIGCTLVGALVLSPALHARDYERFVSSGEQLEALQPQLIRDEARLAETKASSNNVARQSALEDQTTAVHMQASRLEHAREPYQTDVNEMSTISAVFGFMVGIVASRRHYRRKQAAKT